MGLVEETVTDPEMLDALGYIPRSLRVNLGDDVECNSKSHSPSTVHNYEAFLSSYCKVITCYTGDCTLGDAGLEQTKTDKAFPMPHSGEQVSLELIEPTVIVTKMQYGVLTQVSKVECHLSWGLWVGNC